MAAREDKLVQLITQQGLVPEGELAAVQSEASASGTPLPDALVARGLLTPEKAEDLKTQAASSDALSWALGGPGLGASAEFGGGGTLGFEAALGSDVSLTDSEDGSFTESDITVPSLDTEVVPANGDSGASPPPAFGDGGGLLLNVNVPPPMSSGMSSGMSSNTSSGAPANPFSDPVPEIGAAAFPPPPPPDFEKQFAASFPPPPPEAPVNAPPPPPASRPSSESRPAGLGDARQLGPFELVKMLGRAPGSAVSTYLAKHRESGKPCVLKVVLAGPGISAEQLKDFLEFGMKAQKLEPHPRVIRVLGVGQVEQRFYVAMELIQSAPLHNVIVKGKVQFRAGIRALSTVADGVAHLHKQGVVHGKIHSGNILIDKQAKARLADTGVRRIASPSAGKAMGPAESAMSPEEARDGQADARSDIYKLGVVLYEILTGRLPHAAADRDSLVVKILTEEATSPSKLNPKISPVLDRICLRALSKNPADRFQSALDFRDALIAYREGDVDALQELVPAGATPSRPPAEKAAAEKQAPPVGLKIPVAATGKRPSTPSLLVAGFGALCMIIALMLYLSKPTNETPGGGEGAGTKVTIRGTEDPKPKPSKTPSSVSELSLAEGAWVNSPELALKGKVAPFDAYMVLEEISETGRVRYLDQAKNGRFAFVVTLADDTTELKLSIIPDGRLGEVVSAGGYKVDLAAPKIELDDFDKETLKTEILVSGSCSDRALSAVTVNSQVIAVDANGRFEYTVSLKEGSNTIEVQARDKAGNLAARSVDVVRRTIKTPPPPTPTPTPTPTPKGPETPPTPKGPENPTPAPKPKPKPPAGPVKLISSLKIPDAKKQGGLPAPLIAKVPFKLTAELDKNIDTVEVLTQDKKSVFSGKTPTAGAFETKLDLADGTYELTLVAKDIYGREQKKSLAVMVDTNPPIIKWGFGVKWDKIDPKNPPLTLTGSVIEGNLAALTWRGEAIKVEKDGSFEKPITFKDLRRKSTLEAKDLLGKTATAEVDKPAEDKSVLTDLEQWIKAGKTVEGRGLQNIAILEVAIKLAKKGFEVDGEPTVYEGRRQQVRVAAFRHVKSGLRLHLIPGGTFNLGTKQGVDALKGSQRKVEPYLLGQTEVPILTWEKFAPRVRKAVRKGDDFPLIDSTWEEITGWMRGAGNLRLPSEVEWEYALRSGTTTKYFWGEDFDPSYVWCETNAQGNPRSVKEHLDAKKWNGFGLVDMLGNVAEWCADDYIDNAVQSGSKTQKPLIARPRSRESVVKGGHSFSEIREYLTGFRSMERRIRRRSTVGFRVAASIPSK